MKRKLTLIVAICVGLGLLGIGVVVGLLAGPTTTEGVPGWLAALVGLLVAALAAGKLLRNPDDERVAPAPWTETGALVERSPEETPDTDRISGTAFTDHIDSAAAQARREETVEAGLAAVRGPLRQALVAALQQGGWDERRIDDALASGSWTDDPVAAAVVDERVGPPVRSLRRRVWAWLFPEKAVRHRTARTVGAIARVADSVLPPVVGQRAPRPVPIVEPTIDDLQRAADGSLRRAVEGRAAVRAPGTDEATGEAGDDGPADAESTADESGVSDGEADTPSPSGDEAATDNEWPRVGGDD